MIQSHFEDTHLCIKCSRTIVGLENYIEHRKQNCLIAEESQAGNRPASHHDHDDEEEEELEGEERAKNAGPPQLMISTPRSNDHSYGPFEFPEPDHEAPLGQHGGKTGKSLGESYDLPYDLCADAFFSSLQLQSVQTGGKSGSHVVRDKADHNDTAVSWIETSTPAGGAAHQSTDNLMKAVQDLSGSKKPYEAMFKPISFGQDSPDVSDDEEEEEEIVPGEIYDDDDEEDDDQMPHSSGGKWKFPLQSHSPPVVPVTHTGGKWKPEHRPSIHVTHTQLARISPNWDDPAEEPEVAAESGQHPPAEHTKGKWVPQTKTQRLDYKEKSLSRPQQVYWCNICCRKLKTRTLYDKHLKTRYHLKRAEREVHLERADLEQSFLSQAVSVEELREACQQTERRLSAAELKKGSRRRHRRKTFVKCEICRLVVRRHLIGKHLICHYHYRRMQMSRGHLNDALAMLLENIHQVVFQSPFQCLPCRFYFNTEEAFLQHWSSEGHRKVCEGPGRFWCQLCDFTCEENGQMLDHLMGFDHREVVKVINRSFPICIAKKLDVECLNCSQTFRYNVELRKHLQMYHPDCGEAQKGTASASYQRLFKCRSCGESLHSKVALQRHEKNAHSITKYFCTACCMEFATACQARRHRKTMGHRKRTKEGEGEHDAGKSLRQEEASPLACDKCNFRASSDIEAMLHSIGHQEETQKAFNENRATSLPTESPKKPSEVSKRYELSKHTSPAKKSKNKTQKCRDCAEEFPSLEDLLSHRGEKHPLLRHVCMMCGDIFPTSQALGRHSRGCQAGKGELPVSLSNKDKWSCEQCNFKASYESELIYHGFFHTHGVLTKQSRLACPFCGKISGRDSLRCHLRLHTNEKIFECEICKLKFSRRHNLKDHINKFHRRPEATTTGAAAAERLTTDVTDGRLKTTTAPSPAAGHQGSAFPCLTCGKVFLSQTLLAQHCGTHDEHGERNFTCTHEGCHYVGLSGERLQRHMAKHTPDPLKCPVEGCPYVGSSETNLKKHSKSKHAPAATLYKCDICDFTDRSKAHLQRHLRTHTGEKPFGCPYCDVRCNTFDNIRKHILKTNNHPGRYVYECKLCQAAGGVAIFKSNSNVEYKKHLKDKHHGGKVA